MKRNSIVFIIIFHIILIASKCYSQEFEMPGYIYDITSSDIDANGANDILVSCPYTDTIAILYNDGLGNFEIYYYNRACGFILSGNIDSDDFNDIITRDGYFFYCIRNLGNRVLSESIILLTISGTYNVTSIIDINEDSLNDLIYTHTSGEYWGIFKNHGDLTFTNEIMQSGSSTTNPGVGLITDDSLPDIVLSYSAFDRTSISINNGNLSLTEIVLEDNFNYETPVMNLDNLGTDDFAFVNYATNKVALYKYKENDQFELQSNFYASGTYGIASFLAGDFNQDGFDDFIISRCNWYDCTDSIYVYFNNHNWSFYEMQRFYIGYLGSFNLKSADLNGDSFPDLYMSGAGTNGNLTLKILWNDGTGHFSGDNPVYIKDNESIIYHLKAFPNPFTDKIIVEISSNNTPLKKVTIYDLFGRIVRDFPEVGTTDKQIFSIIWDGTNNKMVPCSEGLYILNIRTNSQQVSKKIIKY
jgi:hypothetical protein